MKFLDKLFEFLDRKNKKLIYFLLQSIKDCVEDDCLDNYAIQIDCIKHIQWVLDVEVDLYMEDDSYCKDRYIKKWEKESKIAEVKLVDIDKKIYRLKFYVVNGHIFSIEGTLPFKKLKIENIKDLKVYC